MSDGVEVIDGELLETAECSAYPNRGRCTHTRCILRERNALREQIDSLTARAVRAEEMLTRATAAYEGSTRDLLADKKRLDWLDATHCDVLGAEWSGGRWHQFLLEDEDGTIIGEGATIREAIDKAIARPATP